MNKSDIEALRGFKSFAKILFGPAFGIIFDALVDGIIEEYEQAMEKVKEFEKITF